jgi:hypothetical protein
MNAICSQLCQSNSSSTPTWALNSDSRVRGKYSGPPRPLLGPKIGDLSNHTYKSSFQGALHLAPILWLASIFPPCLLATPSLAHLLPPVEHLPATPPTKKLLDTARWAPLPIAPVDKEQRRSGYARYIYWGSRTRAVLVRLLPRRFLDHHSFSLATPCVARLLPKRCSGCGLSPPSDPVHSSSCPDEVSF